MKNSPVLTVAQLNLYVKSVLEGDFRLKDIYIKGEISNFTAHYKTGHYYFTLKEGGSAVKAVMFASYAKNVPFTPENGMAVLARAFVSLYERDGAYQLYVYELQPVGKGSLQLAYEQLFQKLKNEGLFEESRKRPLPRYPEKVGIITSETGAAVQDIISIISRRYPPAQMVLYPATVQGEKAVPTLLQGLKALGRPGVCDVIIIGRGGGPLEDLWAFNNESLVRAVAACPVPVVSAVGHETDFTLCDFAADLRAPTPSAAAELVVPQWEKVAELLRLRQAQVQNGLLGHLRANQQRFDELLQQPALKNYSGYLEEYTKNIEYFAKSIHTSVKNVIMRKNAQLSQQAACLQLQNPWQRLSLGYSIAVNKEGKTVSTVKQVQCQEVVTVEIADGRLHCTVNKIEEIQRGGEPWLKN